MKKIGLIGETLGHSYSPLIHSKFGDYEYLLCETKPSELKNQLNSKEFDGFNITIPYKEQVMKYCNTISHEAMEIGSVNTIIREATGNLCGYNTDYYGFKYLLEAKGIDPKGLKVLVLGSGGASLAVQAVMKECKAKEVVVISRQGENNYENIKKHSDGEIIVNTTPVGMYPNNGVSPVNLDDFPKCIGVVDLIYNPNKTKIILDAMAKSIPCSGGLEMLVAQAKQASELFQGKAIDEEEIPNVLDEIRRETLNTILIGMPGSGKTMIGQQIARRMNRKFVDIDDLIVEKMKKTIPEIFEKYGEHVFRKVETEILDQVCKETGLVIATGGGIVKKKINYNIIKQNGIVIWVKRDLDKLETEGRPLSQSTPLQNLYDERKGAYAYWSDFFINNNEERE